MKHSCQQVGTKDNGNIIPPRPPFRKRGIGGFERAFSDKKGIIHRILFFVVILTVLTACGGGGGGGGGSSSGGGGTTVSVPSAPGGVSASAGNEQITISWNPVSGATSYNTYWSLSSGVTKSTGTPITGATSPYTHTGRTNGTTYYYVVTAANSAGESAESSEVSAVFAPPPPP